MRITKIGVFFILCTLFNIPSVYAAGITNAYLSGTVRVSVPNQNEGFGFIVGERNNELYILTAEHVVAGPPGTPPPQVYFYQDQAKAVAAEVLVRVGKPLDAALLRVTKPQRIRWQAQSFCLPPYQPPETVWFIGRDKQWFIPSGRDEGQLNAQEPDYYGHLELSIGSVRPGTSGAPLLNSKGLIGMIIEDQGNGARAVAIDNLRRLVRHKNYPWDLLSCGSKPPPVITPGAVPPNPVVQKTQKLLKACTRHLQANRLTSGAGGTALACYTQ
ncbi:S1 family peptidase, partial [Candidatus Venteria ishoeyi]